MNYDHMPSTNRFSKAAELGLRVFPALPKDKRPAIPWKKFQTEAPTPDEITSWDASDFNVCVVAGAASDIVVLDVDSHEAQQLVDKLGLPVTPSVRTSRGRHLYYRRPKEAIPNTVHVGGEKLDVRGDGGYVIGPGSIHPDGTLYEWIVTPDEVSFAPFPTQLRELLAQGKKSVLPTGTDTDLPTTGIGGLDRYLTSELAEVDSEVAAAGEGERNNVLFKMAARIARHVAAAQISWEPFAAAITVAARSVGLEPHEISRTLASGWKSGSAEPTSWILLATQYVYLAFQERFYHLSSGTDLKPSGFHGQFGHLYWGKGSFANFLLRADCVRKVHDLTYDPFRRQRFFERDGRDWLNTYRPSAVHPVEGDASPFEDFMEGFVPDEGERTHLLKMIAFTVRHPGKKLRYGLLMRSAVQGVGKSMLINIWGELLGTHNVRKTTTKEIAGDFQGYLPQNLLIVCEELNLGMGHRAYNDLKDMITADKAPVNEKHLRPREWPLFGTFVFLSNLEAPMLIEKTDRRIFFIDTPAERRAPDYYVGFAAWWKAHLGVIRRYLDEVDLTGFNQFEAPPMTASKLRLIERSQSELAQELALAVRERQGCFDRDVVTLDEVLNELRSSMGAKTKTQMIKALKEIGAVPLGQQRMKLSPRASLWAIRNTSYWTYTDAIARAEEAHRMEGLFAFLDGSHIEVGHLSQYPGPLAQ